MPKLTDLQSILLTHAAGRDSGSLYPLPASVAGDDPRTAKTIAQLLRRALVEEKEVSDAATIHRSDNDLRYGLFITPAGLTAIGVEDAAGGSEAPAGAAPPAAPDSPRQTKAALVLGLLHRDGGATLAELVEATGWLPHTTRAALTGLRKKGHAIKRERRDGTSCYRIGAAA